MKYLFRLYMLAVLLALGGTCQGIDIIFSATNCGESVEIWDTYLIDDSVSVDESASASFNSVEMVNNRIISGSGDSLMYQDLFGSGAGADCGAELILLTDNAGRLQEESSASIKPASCEVSRSVCAGDADFAATGAYGYQEGGLATITGLWPVPWVLQLTTANMAGAGSLVIDGSMDSQEYLKVGNSVEVRERANLDAMMGGTAAGAMDSDLNMAGTIAGIGFGRMSTVQTARADGSASVTQDTNMYTTYGLSATGALDSDWNMAGTVASIGMGTMDTVQTAEADGSASATQASYIVARSIDTYAGALSFIGLTADGYDDDFDDPLNDHTQANTIVSFANDNTAYTHGNIVRDGTLIWHKP